MHGAVIKSQGQSAEPGSHFVSGSFYVKVEFSAEEHFLDYLSLLISVMGLLSPGWWLLADPTTPTETDPHVRHLCSPTNSELKNCGLSPASLQGLPPGEEKKEEKGDQACPSAMGRQTHSGESDPVYGRNIVGKSPSSSL